MKATISTYNKFLFLFLIFILQHFYAVSQIQSFPPNHYWNFENSNWQNCSPPSKNASSTLSSNGKYEILESPENSFLKFPNSDIAPFFVDITLGPSITIECRMRISSSNLFNKGRLFWMDNYGIFTAFSAVGWEFNTIIKDKQGKTYSDFFVVPFEGTGELSYEYYLDDLWHHVVFKVDAVKGVKEIWIDGKSNTKLFKKLEGKGEILGADKKLNRLYLNHHSVYKQSFIGELDDISIYHNYIPSALHAKHVADRLSNKPYSFKADLRSKSTKVSTSSKAVFDMREFAPGHPNVSMSPLEQLQHFPLPRFKPGHQLKWNVNWMDPRYFAGEHLEGVSKQSAIRIATEIQKELASNWHYMLHLGNSNYALDPANLNIQESYLRQTIDLANQHKDWPLSIITLWGQAKPTTQKGSGIFSQTLSSEHYLQAKSKRFIDNTGKEVKTGSRKYISPITPTTEFQKDGRAIGYNLQQILSYLERPIDLINENGEVPPLPYSIELLSKSPDLSRAYDRFLIQERRYISDLNSKEGWVSSKEQLAWDIFQASQKKKIRNSYSNAFLLAPSLKEKLQETAFTWYAIDGGPAYLDRFEWVEARKSMRPMRGQYYSTPNFYPRWPNNWKKWKGSYRGLGWIEMCRKKEILIGDKLFSPFVAAGWEKDPTRNLRPSQWLGLLKLLNIMGAEFFYTGVFNERNKDFFPNPYNYAWQAAMPIYAQAIASRYEEVLLSGDVLKDANGSPILLHNSGDPRIPVAVRKHPNKDIYVIAGTIQPNSNIMGNVPDTALASIQLQGKTLIFPVRRQGSVYTYDLSDPQKPVFIQLDTWHEAGHPSYWSSSTYAEAEVYDMGQNVSSVSSFTSTNSTYDYSKSKTFIKRTGDGLARAYYNYSYRGKGAKRNLSLKIKARSIDGTKAEIDIYTINPNSSASPIFLGKGCIKHKQWQWTSMRSGKRYTKTIKIPISQKEQSIMIQWNNPALQIDAIELN